MIRRGFTARFIIYGIVVAYVLLDLNVLQGPVYKWVREKQGYNLQDLREQGVAAVVYGQPIMKGQVSYRIEEYLYARGRTVDSVTPQEHSLLASLCLEELIHEALLRVKVHHNEVDLPPLPEELLGQELRYDQAQFGTPQAMAQSHKRYGFLPDEFALRSRAHLQQRQYLHRQIKVDETIPEGLAPETIQIPDLYRIRHLFLTTWDKDPAVVEQQLQQHLAPLRTGWATFEKLSDRINEDPRAKLTQGELGWVSLHRLPDGLAEPLAQMQPGEHRLIQTTLGWHYLELLERTPARTIPMPKDQQLARIQNQQRTDGLALYLRHLRTRESNNVLIVPAEASE